MPDFTRMKIEILSSQFSSDVVLVKRVTGHEKISRLFEFRVQVVVMDRELTLTPEQLRGESVSLVIHEEGEVHRQIHGMVACAEESFAVSVDHEQFELLIVPHVWQLTTIMLQEVYIDQSVPDLIRRKFARANLGKEGTDFEFQLHGNYPKIPFIIQYQESDFDFISRLAEDVGISYYFVHSDQSEEVATDKIVFCDFLEAFPGIASTTFERSGQKVGLYELGWLANLVPYKYAVRDYNYESPQVDLTGVTEAKGNGGVMGATIEYGNHFESPAEATSLVEVRAEEAACHQSIYKGRSDLLTFSAGRCFSIEDYPKVSDALLLVELHHEFIQTVQSHDGHDDDRFYLNSFEAIPRDRNYRPPRVTPVPKMPGVVTGFIVSESTTCRNTLPSTAAADIDDQGRYLVEFHLDTPGDSSAAVPSKRIRMAQPCSGASYGIHMPLRPGTEVVVAFLNGDVRRPVIMGAVHNATSPSPVTALDATKTRIQSQTGLMIEFCDAPDGN